MEEKEKIVEYYIETFGSLPPNDITIDYYDDFYQKLMIEAIETGKEITPDVLEEKINLNKYDYVKNDKGFSKFKKESK